MPPRFTKIKKDEYRRFIKLHFVLNQPYTNEQWLAIDGFVEQDVKLFSQTYRTISEKFVNTINTLYKDKDVNESMQMDEDKKNILAEAFNVTTTIKKDASSTATIDEYKTFMDTQFFSDLKNKSVTELTSFINKKEEASLFIIHSRECGHISPMISENQENITCLDDLILKSIPMYSYSILLDNKQLQGEIAQNANLAFNCTIDDSIRSLIKVSGPPFSDMSHLLSERLIYLNSSKLPPSFKRIIKTEYLAKENDDTDSIDNLKDDEILISTDIYNHYKSLCDKYVCDDNYFTNISFKCLIGKLNTTLQQRIFSHENTNNLTALYNAVFYSNALSTEQQTQCKKIITDFFQNQLLYKTMELDAFFNPTSREENISLGFFTKDEYENAKNKFNELNTELNSAETTFYNLCLKTKAFHEALPKKEDISCFRKFCRWLESIMSFILSDNIFQINEKVASSTEDIMSKLGEEQQQNLHPAENSVAVKTADSSNLQENLTSQQDFQENANADNENTNAM